MMPMIPHRNHFLKDFYHCCLASFWAVERGLSRLDGEERTIAKFLFPDLSDNPLPLLRGRSWFFLSLVGPFLVTSHLTVVSRERVAKRPGRIVGLWRKGGGVVVCSLAC
jgi:hypothetical protein